MIKKIICFYLLLFILSGCEGLPTLPNLNLNPNENAKPVVIAWGGMYEIVNEKNTPKASYYHKAYSEEQNESVKSIFKKMKAYFLSDKFRFSKFSSVQVFSSVDAKDKIDTEQLYTLILVPTFELSNHKKWSNIHDHLLYAGISALIVKPGEARIVAASSGIVSKRYKSTQPLQEKELISNFRKLYADAAAIALTYLQKQKLQPSQSYPSIITDVYVENSKLKTLFKINGTRLEAKRSCKTKDCQMLGNMAAQLAAQKLLRNGEFVLPPFTGLMSEFGSKWGWYAEEKMVNLIGVDLGSKARKPIKIKINPAESKRFVAVHITNATETKVSKTGNEIWHFNINGNINWCKNTLEKTSDHIIEGSRSQQTFCDKANESGTLMRFDNQDNPTEYKAAISAPSNADRKDNYLGSLLNALGN